METPVTLGQSRSRSRKSLSANSDRICVVHYISTSEIVIKSLTEETFTKLKDAASERLNLENPSHRLVELSYKLPECLNPDKHGVHKRCYKLFTNIPKIRKRCYDLDENNNECRTTKRQKIASVLFPNDSCLFCGRGIIKIKGVKQGLIKCVTKQAEHSILKCAEENNNQVLLCKIRDQELVAREAHYHRYCRKEETRPKTRNKREPTPMSLRSRKAHREAFEYISIHIEHFIIRDKNIERMTMLRDRYLTFLLEHYPDVYNVNYKTDKLKDKIAIHFQNKVKFWKPNYKSELVYSADVEGGAIEKAFNLAALEERQLDQSALILRRKILDGKFNSSASHWPPSHEWLLSGERKPPEMLTKFLKTVITGSKSGNMSSIRANGRTSSIAEDICFAATNSDWLMPKHILLPMTVRHLTGSAELITILNRYGHGQSYSKTLELETAMCSLVLASESALPKTISAENNKVLHFCWDNFDLNEETPSGSGTKHGIVIQKVKDSSTNQTKCISDSIVITKKRSIEPPEIIIKPCFAKSKVEPILEMHTVKPEYDFEDIDIDRFVWYFCMKVGGHLTVQSVPQWSGWLSKTTEDDHTQSLVEYMAPVNNPI